MLAAARSQGPLAIESVQALQALLTDLLGSEEPARLVAINDFFNRRIAWSSDQAVWGQEDYWASPVEMLGKGRGDCEDYVIGKYFALLATGMPVAKLRLVYVRVSVAGGEAYAHMVLAYYAAPGAEPLILDSLVAQMLPAARRPDLTPVFSFSGEGLWHGTGGQVATDPQARLSPWKEVLAKARAEGFR